MAALAVRQDASIARAAFAFKQQDFAEAEAQCRSLLALQPENANALHLLGLVRRKRGDLAEAEQLLRASINKNPGLAEFRINFSNLLRAAGRLRDAEAELRAALRLEPRSRSVRLALVRVLNEGGAALAAADEASALIEQDCRDAEAWLERAVAERRLGRNEASEASFRQALDIRPDYAVARHNYGALLCELQQAERALEELDHARRLGIDHPEAKYNKASALFTLGRFDEAEANLAEALQRRPEYVDAHVLLAKLRYMRGDPDFARDLKRVAGQSTDLRLRMALGDLLLRAGRTGEAAAILRKAADEYPDAAEVGASLAVVLQEQGELPEALRLAEQAHVLLPDSADTTDTLVALLLQLGKPEQALPLIERQREQSPLDQRWLAHAATASRLQGGDEYAVLYDYDRLVGVFDLPAPAAYESREAFNRTLAERLHRLHNFNAHPLDQSLRHGTQTVRDLAKSDDPVIADFLKLVEAPLEQYRAQLDVDDKHPFLRRNRGAHAFAGCWSVQLRQGGFHVNHIHPKGWISSVYYVEVPDEVSDTSARAGWLKFGEPRRTTPGAEPARFVKPEVGRLVLFPSYLWHGTVPIAGEQSRMTIAFDVVPAADRS